ncbi:MAG TPA: lipopolysaccharide transport periplasmic protein LptA [Burkholderiales bacterium]
MRRRAAGAALAAFSLLATGAGAETSDREKPTQIEANRMSADDVRRLNIFEGNVVLTRGTISVRAERIVVRQDADGYQFATATGTPVRLRQRQDPKPPQTEGVWMDGEALRIEIDDRNGKIEMFEQARVRRGGDEVAGSYIFVDQRSDFFTVKSDGNADQPSGEGRVRAVLQPKPQAVEPRPAPTGGAK